MRADPLLVVLDEPTASLDAPSESALFERYARRGAAARRRAGDDHPARLPPLLDGALGRPDRRARRGPRDRVGTHDELISPRHYAELFELQARASA